jgi:pyridoxamine 5'-phosphate oxidase
MPDDTIMTIEPESAPVDLRGAPCDPAGFRDDPLDQFRLWMADAILAGAREPSAMTLATTGAGGLPDARMVLLRDVDDRGLTFFTNVESVKAAQLTVTPHAAVVFWWYETWRQVRVRGSIEPVDDAAAAAYFATRPRETQIAAWASSQSREVDSRQALEDQVRRMECHGDGDLRNAYPLTVGIAEGVGSEEAPIISRPLVSG